MPLKAFLRPRSLEEALQMRASSISPGAYIAGGTDLLASEDRRLEYVVDLSRLGLGGISRDADAWRLGATTPLADVVRDPRLALFADGIVSRAAACWQTSLLRERATVGGVLAGGHATADFAAALIAVGAAVQYTDTDGDHHVPLEAFYLGEKRTVLGLGIVTAVEIPAAPVRGAHERAARTRADATLVGAAAARWTAGRWRLALCGAGDRPLLLPTPELDGAARIDDGVLTRLSSRICASVSPPDDLRATAGYRRTLAGVLARRVLARLAEARE